MQVPSTAKDRALLTTLGMHSTTLDGLRHRISAGYNLPADAVMNKSIRFSKFSPFICWFLFPFHHLLRLQTDAVLAYLLLAAGIPKVFMLNKTFLQRPLLCRLDLDPKALAVIFFPLLLETNAYII